jgi:hypothetical protein
MRIVEALRTIEDVAYDCKIKSINRADVKAAIDLLYAHVEPARRQIEEFHQALEPIQSRHSPTDSSASDPTETQQRHLRACFRLIYSSTRSKLCAHIKTIEYRQRIKPTDCVRPLIAVRHQFGFRGIPPTPRNSSMARQDMKPCSTTGFVKMWGWPALIVRIDPNWIRIGVWNVLPSPSMRATI